MRAFILVLVLFFSGCVSNHTSVSHKKEKYYQEKFCKKIDGKMEVVLSDRTRVDCLNDEYAVEVDFGKKWAEGIGQALYYSEMTGKKPAVALIVGSRGKKYLKRLEKVANHYGIKIFIIRGEK